MLGPERNDLDISPDTIPHSFSGHRSMHVMSTGFKGKVGTSHKLLEARDTPCPLGTLPTSMSMTEIKSVTDLQNSSSASAIPLKAPSEPSLS